ncbi:hypothetical protein EDB95_5460 [Dinghuibacter silviterrae]|uniref:Uncharacterized protein n=2 Tax=Dinghuibacter silviterrae TaxID=1539049 RepID=A0A4R8DIM4_9BACT|nr:hypothetical protein EDB95_5460 [Dinghuibacter silviterrae]
MYGVVAVACMLFAGCAKHDVRPIDNNPLPTTPPAPGLPTFYSGPSHPPPLTGVRGDFFLDVSDSLLYGPKSTLGWGHPDTLPEQVNVFAGGPRLWTGGAAPGPTVGNIPDFYLDMVHANLYGPKSASGWGASVTLPVADTSVTPSAPQGSGPVD